MSPTKRGNRRRSAGSKAAAKTRRAPRPTTPADAVQPRLSLPRPQHTGDVVLTVTPQFTEGDPRNDAVTPSGSPGRYLAQFVLGRPGQETHSGAFDVAAFLRSGDSLVAMVPGGTLLQSTVRHELGEYGVQLRANDQGRLALATVELDARSFDDAQRQAHDAVQGLLTFLSLRYDVAIGLLGWVIVEVATQSISFRLGRLGEVRTAAVSEVGALSPDHQAIAASYRQGLSTTNAFLAVLSFWRVIEGVRNLRVSRRSAALPKTAADDPSLRDPPERIPSDSAEIVGADEPWLAESFAPYLGRKFTAVTEALRGTLRNAMTHIDPENLTVISPDRIDDVRRAEDAIPVLRYMARKMLDRDLGDHPAT